MLKTKEFSDIMLCMLCCKHWGHPRIIQMSPIFFNINGFSLSCSLEHDLHALSGVDEKIMGMHKELRNAEGYT